MPFEHTFPGQPLRIKSSDWNAAMDAARAVASGETGQRARIQNTQPGSNIVLVKNASGADLERYAVVDIDEAVYSADDNENGYKNGPSLIATGAPVAGRLAFCGVLQEPIAEDKFGRVALAGWTVGYVSGTDNFAWPVAGDLEAFETRNSGGYPILDRGSADEDGYSLATILLTQTTESGDGTSAGLPTGSYGCGCSDCVDGTANHECGACGCINRRRAVAMPVLTFPDGTIWEEVAAINRVNYAGGCLWTSKKVRRYCTIGEGEEAEEVFDNYRLEVDYAAGTAVLVWMPVDPEDEEEVPNCDPITLKWVLCPDCSKKCLCPWIFDVASSEEDGFNNIRHPGSCKLCVTPIRRNTGAPVCGINTATLGDYIKITIPAFDPGDGVCDPGPLIVGLLAPDYLSGDPMPSPFELPELSDPGALIAIDTSAALILYIPISDEEVPNCTFYSSAYLIGESEFQSVDIGVCCVDGDVAIAVEISFGYGCGSPSEDLAQAQWQFVGPSEGITNGPHEAVWEGGAHPVALPNLLVEFASPPQLPASSSGHVGSNCGAEEACDLEECILEVVEYAGSNRWITSEDSTCSGECENNCAPGCDVIHPVCGDANEFEPGYKCLVGDCTPFDEMGETVSVTFAASGSCTCGTMNFQMCLNAGTGRYEATLLICGVSYDIQYYEDGGVWYFDIGGAIDSDANPAGPFVTSYSEDDPLCEGISVTVAV